MVSDKETKNEMAFLEDLKKLQNANSGGEQKNSFEKLKEISKNKVKTEQTTQGSKIEMNEIKKIVPEQRIEKIEEKPIIFEKKEIVQETGNKKNIINEKNAVIREPEKELELKSDFFTRKEKPIEQKFSWENKENIDMPREEDFEEIRTINEETPIGNTYKELQRQRNTMSFDWEERAKIDMPREEDFSPTHLDWMKKEINPKTELSDKKERDETEFPWEVNQKIGVPTREDFINSLKQDEEIKKDFSSSVSENFDWMKHEIIDAPKKDDFTIEEPTGNMLNKEIEKQQGIADNKIQSTNVLENKKIENEKIENKENITTKKEELPGTGPRWKTTKSIEPKEEIKAEFKPSGEEKIKGPKWFHKKTNDNAIPKQTEEQKVGETKIEEKVVLEKKETLEKNKPSEGGARWKHTTISTPDEKKVEGKAQTIVENKTKEEQASVTKTSEKENQKIESTVGKTKVVDSGPRWKTTGTEDTETKKASHLKTPIDGMFEILEKYKSADTEQLGKVVNMSSYDVEQIMKDFEDYDIVKIKYPTSLKKKPRVILKKVIEPRVRKAPVGEILDSYKLEVDDVPAEVEIILSKDEARPLYTIKMPAIGPYTKKFLEFLKNEIAENIPVELEEIMDPKKSKHLKDRFFEESQKHLIKYFPQSSKEMLNTLSGVILHEMYGLGDIEVILGDDMLEEVAINSAKTPITVYHRIHGWLKTNLYPGTETEIMNYSSQIGRKVGREITTLSPILDAHLLSGDRVNATLFPISSEGNTLTIRRFARKPWTLVDFIGKAHTMSSEMAAFLWLAIQFEMNVIVSGGTASGKTSTLNTLLSLVPSYHRLISIEDVREIVLPVYLKWNWIPMVTRSANPEGLGEVTMLDCMISSLRMRPDRIIVGEIRRKREAEVLMEAIETGHSIYSTIHANSAYQVLRRLGEAPMSIPVMQIEQLDIIVVQFRDRKTNKRRTYEIAEIEQTSTGKGLQVNTIFKWVPRTDTWEQLNKPTKILTLLNMHTGLTEAEIYKELDKRKAILEWMLEQNISDLDMIGYVVKLFYTDPTRVDKMAKDKVNADKIKEMM